MSRVTLVPGWTAWSWVQIARVLLLVGVLATATELVSIYGGSAGLAAFGFTAGAIGAWFAARIRCAMAQERERGAGYTTLVTIDDPFLNQVDGATGIVVRAQGTPMLSTQDFVIKRARLRRAFGSAGR